MATIRPRIFQKFYQRHEVTIAIEGMDVIAGGLPGRALELV